MTVTTRTVLTAIWQTTKLLLDVHLYTVSELIDVNTIAEKSKMSDRNQSQRQAEFKRSCKQTGSEISVKQKGRAINRNIN